MTSTNIKNLPEGEYFTEIGYSQSYPWKVLKRTAKTITLAKVEVTRDPEWKPEFIPGGFAAHCTNQSDQTWLFGGVNEAITKIIRLVKSPYVGETHMWAHKGTRFLEETAREYYDYNF